jgi:protein required for attachment to host cells
MAKSLDAEMAAIEAEERKLGERRQVHRSRVREAAIGEVEKAGLLKLPLDRLEALMKAVKTLGVDEVEKRLTAKA